MTQQSALATMDPVSAAGEPLLVRRSRILPFPGQPRRYFNPKTLEELADEFMDPNIGQKQPVMLCKSSKNPGYFILIDGERRWRGFGIVEERTGKDPLMKCFIDVVNDEKHHFLQSYLSNALREDLVPIDQAAAYHRFYKESSERSHHARVSEVAKIVKKSTTHVENYLLVNKLPDEVKKFMDPELPKSEQLSVTSAIDIARGTKNHLLQLRMAKEAVERNLDTAQVRMLVSVRTGQTGLGIGGRMRSPSDDYKLLKSFIGRITNTSGRLAKIDLRALYSNRDDEFGDRERDSASVEDAIDGLKKILGQIKIEKGS